MGTDGNTADLAAAFAVRRELGEEYEDEIVESFLKRIEARVAERAQSRDDGDGSGLAWMVALSSLGLGIPLSVIAGDHGGFAGMLVAWTGIVGVNIAHAWSRRRGVAIPR